MNNYNEHYRPQELTVVLPFTEMCILFRNAIVYECGGLLEHGQIPNEMDTVDITRMFAACILEPIRMRDPVIYNHMTTAAVTRLIADLRNYTTLPNNIQVDDLALRLSTTMERIMINQLSAAVPDIDHEGVRILSYDVIRDALYIVLYLGY